MYSCFIIILAFFPIVQCSCSDYKDCVSCANSSTIFVNCRWCQLTKTCHAPGSIHNSCKGCTDSSISKLCSVTDPKKCDRNNDNDKKSGDFEPYDAYHALLYSAVAYSEDPSQCASKIFRDGDIEIVEIIGRRCNYLFKYQLCFAITAVSDSEKRIILAYRGTTSKKQLIEEFATVLGKFKVSTKIGGNIQEYFSNANDKLYPCVKSSVEDLVNKYPTYSVSIAGHSLGGAVASIASAQLVFDSVIDREKTTLYTFGMPRTGDQEYAENHDRFVTKSWRIVHYRDAVSKLPTMTHLSGSPYHHQREIFYGAEMSMMSDYIECFNYEDEKCGQSVLPSPWSIDYHTIYYGIQVGGHCDDQVNKRKRRSADDIDVRHLFTNATCKRIKASDISGTNDYKSGYSIVLSFVLLLYLNNLQ